VNVPPKTAATDAFWQAFARHAGLTGADYQVAAFGDNAAMASELVELVLAGTKRATVSLARDYADGRAPPARVGDFVVVIDGTGAPRCIWRTTEIEIKPLGAVDARFAWDEGEGERTCEWWLAAHRRYFGRQASREGFAFDDSIETVFDASPWSGRCRWAIPRDHSAPRDHASRRLSGLRRSARDDTNSTRNWAD
jgi:uncharacterized protein YhfF